MENLKHIMDIVKKFGEIIASIEDSKLKIVKECKVAYESQDARLVALDSIQMELSQTGMWITSFNSLANKCMIDEKTINEHEFLRSLGSSLSLAETEDYMMTTLRLGLITLVHFKIDNLFQNILRKLNLMPSNKGYWNLAKVILEQSSLSKSDTEMNTLMAVASLRNSLHNNGIHRTENLSIELAGTKFEFIKNKRIECASWHHIILLLEANIDIIKEILSSEKIISIKEIIEDDFSYEVY